MTTTAAPTLSSYWLRPSDPACLQSSDYWIWSWAPSSDARTVLGGPSQTSSCLPLGWDSTRTYAGTACPPQYTPGCPDTGDGVVTCCPTAHPFTCQEKLSTLDHGEWFRCILQYRQSENKSITIADMNAYKTTTTVRTHGTNAHLHALAVLYQTPTQMSFYQLLVLISTAGDFNFNRNNGANDRRFGLKYFIGRAK
ncbi:uncharacterized protein PG986_005076 [Apiospora aurea]|uniref:Uncharacterized protein n=1 Tax=Apiospora aurea TaxID=335848 RepID=A0ABR1QGI0_9PEZI